MHPDGTVIAVYNRGTSFSFGSAFSNGSGITSQSAVVATSTLAADAANPTVTTTYYVSDQIGSSRMDIAYGSWPTWWGAFNPYGTEIDTNATTNNFKFSGMERDAQVGEAGLDNFGGAVVQFRSGGQIHATRPGRPRVREPVEPAELLPVWLCDE